MYITAEAVQCRRASIRCKGKCREILLPAELCRRLQKMVPEAPHPHRAGVFVPRGAGAEPGDGVEDHEGAVQPGAGGVEEGFPHNLAASVCAHLLLRSTKTLQSWADLLGHSSIETTRIYIMESGEEHLAG